MASACRRENSAALGSSAYSPIALPAEIHPYFAEVAPLRVSSHLVVQRDGALTQYVSFADRAWHAGQSSYQGRAACNDFSVGVELEGTDALPYEATQYAALAEVVAALCAAYPRLSADRLVGHSDIAPGRKTDPGPAFDWPRARRLIGAACRQVPPRRAASARLPCAAGPRRELGHVFRGIYPDAEATDFPGRADT